MTKFYLCCPVCEELSCHPLYEELDEVRTIWNTEKNKEFLESHNDTEKCGIVCVQFVREDAKGLLKSNGYTVQKDTRD
jgi:hypothetical protein